MPTKTLEREVKLGVGLDYSLPDLSGVIDGVIEVELASAELVATYHDTPDRRLLARGVTLRHRRDRAVPGDDGKWTLKLPAPGGGDGLERTEISWDGKDTEVPEEARRLLRGILRRAELQPVVKLITTRRRFEIKGRTGKRLAEIDDDTVAVMDGLKLADRFREVEVELEAGDDELLDSVVARLSAAGARREKQEPKVARALHYAPARDQAAKPSGKMTLGELVAHAVATGVDRLLSHDPWVRLSADPEHIHQARVATRRLRSDLRTFADGVDEAWTAQVRDDLKWVGLALGEVRDADVLAVRLEAQGRRELTDDDVEGLGQLKHRLSAQRQEAYERLLTVLDSDRYIDVIDALAAGTLPPRTAEMDRSAKDAVGPLVKRSWKKLRRAAGRLPDRPGDAELHQVRIKAKQLRYGAEAAAVVIGKPALRLAKASADLQDILGEHHDAVAAEAWLRQAAGALEASSATFVAGELVMIQRRDQEQLRRGWRSVWKSLRAKRLRSWLG